MIKQILYTKNPNCVNTIEAITKYAEVNNEYYTCMVNEESYLWNAKPGSHILTTKGNDLYILETSMRYNAFDFAKPSSITEPVIIEL